MVDLIFLHGFYSSPASRKIQHFTEILPDSIVGDKIHNYHILDLYPNRSDFESMTISSLVEKIGTVVEESEFPCYIVGSSHGGLLALATQAAYPEQIAGLVLLAPAIRYYAMLTDRYDIDAWQSRGYIRTEFTRYGTPAKLGWEYMADLTHYESWEPVDISILAIHGKKDDVIPVEHTKQYSSSAFACTEYYPAEGVHHLGNVLEQVTAVLIHWLDDILTE